MGDCEYCRNYWNNGKEEDCDVRGWDFVRSGCPNFSDKRKPRVETNLYDTEEIHPNCTVQIWRNSQTGEESIGWWPNE